MYQYRNNQTNVTYRIGELVVAPGETVSVSKRLDPEPPHLECLTPRPPVKKKVDKPKAVKTPKVIKDETTDSKTSN